MLFKHVATRDIMRYLEQVSDIVEYLVIAKADDYLLTSRWREIRIFLLIIEGYQEAHKVLFPFDKQFPALRAT